MHPHLLIANGFGAARGRPTIRIDPTPPPLKPPWHDARIERAVNVVLFVRRGALQPEGFRRCAARRATARRPEVRSAKTRVDEGIRS